MKKLIIILTFIIILINQNPVFAEANCPVKSGPSKGLTRYFQDIESIMSSIKTSISKGKGCGEKGNGVLDNVTGNIDKGYSKIVGDTNNLINFDGFLSSWEFNLYPIFVGSIPNSFYRDHDYLAGRTEKINSITKQAAKKCALNLKIDSSIQSKLDKYNIEGTTVNEVLSSMRKLNNKTTAFFRCVVVGSMGGCELEENATLKNEIESSYGNDAREACNQDTSFDEVMKKIKKITDSPFGFTALQKGIDEWKAAIKLLGQALGGTNDPEYYKLEKKLLTKELKRQGISGTQADAILNNLSCMNDEKKTIEQCVNASIKSMIQPFVNVYNEIAKLVVNKSDNTKNISRDSYSIKTQNYIFTDVQKNYKNVLILVGKENRTQEKGLATLIQLHQNLNKTNKMLEEHIRPTQQLCNLQGSGEGNCK